jgi:5-methylcytosine-specific restriction endonuclease McrA
MSDPDSTTVPLRTCTACGQSFPATREYFYWSTKQGPFSKCKPCYLAIGKAYRESHRDQRNESARRHYLANRDKRLAHQRERYAETREAVLAKHKEWRNAHPGYWKQNREANPDRVRIKNANRRAALRAAEGKFTPDDIAAQLARQKGKCFYCGAKLDGSRHIDHVVPIALGGTNHPENIVLACQDCNLAKNAKHPMDFAGILF